MQLEKLCKLLFEVGRVDRRKLFELFRQILNCENGSTLARSDAGAAA